MTKVDMAGKSPMAALIHLVQNGKLIKRKA